MREDPLVSPKTKSHCVTTLKQALTEPCPNPIPTMPAEHRSLAKPPEAVDQSTHGSIQDQSFKLKRNDHSPGVKVSQTGHTVLTVHASESTAKKEVRAWKKGQSGWAWFAFGNRNSSEKMTQ